MDLFLYRCTKRLDWRRKTRNSLGTRLCFSSYCGFPWDRRCVSMLIQELPWKHACVSGYEEYLNVETRMCQNCVSSGIKRFSVIRCVSCSDRKREGVCNQMWGKSLGTRRCFHYERSLPWKRECVKHVFLCVSYTFNFPKLNSFFPAQGNSRVFFHYKAHPNSPWCFVPNLQTKQPKRNFGPPVLA